MIPPCFKLSIIRYVSRVKWSNSGKGSASSLTSRCSCYRKGSLLFALNYGRQQLINEILDLCLLDSFFQGDLFLGVSSGLSLPSNFFWREIVGFGSDNMDAWEFAVWVKFCLVCFLEVFSFVSHLECRGRDLNSSLHHLMSLGSCDGRLLFWGYRNIFVQVKGLSRFSLVLLPVGYCLSFF